MKIARRTFFQFAGAVFAAHTFTQLATAQTYPTHPITVIVPVSAGGPGDAIARVLGERMIRSLGQTVIIENVTGAGGSIGVGRVARARPDGYTIGLGAAPTYALNGAFYSLQYDLLNDFAPISPLVTGPFVLLARKTMSANGLNELIAWLKANPESASAGIATAAVQLVTAFFQKETRTQFALVPYRGVAPARQDLLAGQIDLLFDPPDSLSLMQTGGIKAYAVTSDTRLARAPDIPTFAEMGFPSISWSTWYGLFAPKGTPKDIIGKLNAAAVEALVDPAVRARLVEFGGQIFPRDQQTPEALGALVKADAEKWWPIIKELGIKAE
jgi:tripartite-type tricarboxylate transporter receptor subunit TctC